VATLRPLWRKNTGPAISGPQQDDNETSRGVMVNSSQDFDQTVHTPAPEVRSLGVFGKNFIQPVGHRHPPALSIQLMR